MNLIFEHGFTTCMIILMIGFSVSMIIDSVKGTKK
jgi:hypothetical protein